MPIYEYECEVCGTKESAVREIKDRYEVYNCSLCKVPSRLIISVGGLEPFKCYDTENITGSMTHIHSRSHKKRLMREHGVSQV